MKGECPDSVADFGRIPRLAAEEASGLRDVDAKITAMQADSPAWRTYQRVYNETLDGMRKEYGIL